MFNFDRSCAHDWVHRLLPILETALGEKQVLPERKLRSITEFLDRSAQRVKCEHAYASIKRYNAVASIYRNHVTDFDDHLMLVATGLWNFYLEAA